MEKAPKGKNLPLILVLFLSALLVMAKSVVQGERETHNPAKAAPKVIIETEKTYPHKRPYVAPQESAVANPRQENTSIPRLIPPIHNAGTGDPSGKGRLAAQAGLHWGKDIFASDLNWPLGFDITRLSLTSHSMGRIFIAYEAKEDGDPAGVTYIRVSYSEDGGLSWKCSGWAFKTDMDLTDPSIAVTNDTIVLAYVVHPSADDPYVEVATAPLSAVSSAFNYRSILHYADDYELDPYIWTDTPSRPSGDSVYLALEQIYDAGANNINILFQRSVDDGNTWQNLTSLFGADPGDSDEYRDPYGCFGEVNNHYLYGTCYNLTEKTIYLRRSTDNGAGSWNSPQAVVTLTAFPVKEVSPAIAAATAAGNQRLIVVYTSGSAEGDDDIRYLYSANNGATFFGPYVLPGATALDEAGALVHANARGRNFHVTYSRNNNAVLHSRRRQDLVDSFSDPVQVNSGSSSFTHLSKGLTTHWEFDFPEIAYIDFYYHPSAYYSPFFNRLCPDDLVGSWAGSGVYCRTETNKWKKMAVPAELLAVGDVDGDGTDDLMGNWASQGGVWVERSSTQTWTFLASPARDIFCGDMDGDGSDELIGTWDGQGVFYKTSAVGGAWVKMASSADIIAAGDIEGDDTADLLGVWAAQGGVWVKYSSTSTWEKLGSTPRHIGCGDMNGDGRDDLLGTWDSQGVFYLDSISRTWIKMATPATLVAAGDLDGDNKDDLIGIWAGNVWVKYSATSQWAKLSSTATDIAAGMMRAGANSWFAQSRTFDPLGGMLGNLGAGDFSDDSAKGPGGIAFWFKAQMNSDPQEFAGSGLINIAGPGEPGFRWVEQDNLYPQDTAKKKEAKRSHNSRRRAQ